MGYGVLGVLSWGSRITPRFSAPLAARLRRTPKSYRGARTCSMFSITMPIKFGGARISGATGAEKNVEFFVCLSVYLLVCLFVTLLNISVCAPDFAMNALGAQKRFRCRWIGEFLCVHQCSTLKVSKNVSVSALQGLGLVSDQKPNVSISSRSRKLRSRLHPWQIETLNKVVFSLIWFLSPSIFTLYLILL